MSGMLRAVALASVAAAAVLSSPALAQVSGSLKMLAGNELRAGIEPIIDAFKAETGVDIQVSYAEQGALGTVLGTQLSSNSGPDVFTMWPGTYGGTSAVNLGIRGYAMDLSAQPWAADIPERFDNFIGKDGAVYYPPLAALSVVTQYNLGKIEELGLAIPTTWTELLAFCKAAPEKGVTAFAYGAQTDWQNQMVPFLLAATLVDRTDPDFLVNRANGTDKFSDSAWVDVFAKEKEMQDAGCFGDRALGLSYQQAQIDVANGVALGMFAPASTFPSLQAIVPTAKLVVAPLPATDNADETWLPVALGASFGVNANTKNPDAAIAFINYILRPENVAKYAAATGQAPLLPNDQFTPDAVSQLQLTMGAAGKTAPVSDQLFPKPKIRSEWLINNQAMLAGQAEPKTITDAMDAAWDEE